MPMAQGQAVPSQPAVVTSRVFGFDWMRGLVMVLMTVDHASEMFNAGRFVSDAYFLYKPGTPLPVVQFLVRWVTHLCAPTFVFLAGASLALSTMKRLKAGESEASIDRSIVIRGLLIVALGPAVDVVGFHTRHDPASSTVCDRCKFRLHGAAPKARQRHAGLSCTRVDVVR